MKFTKSLLIGTGSAMLAGLIFTLLVPRTVHGVVAAAVQVMNTSATPVPVQSILPGKPFVQSCSVPMPTCTLTPPVPAGYTFVAQHANIFVQAQVPGTASPPPSPFVQLFFQTQGVGYEAFELPANNGGPNAVYDSPVAYYIDPGTQSEIICLTLSTSCTEVIATLTGYLTQ